MTTTILTYHHTPTLNIRSILSNSQVLVPSDLTIFQIATMPAPSTKADWIAKLGEEGEQVPTSWTVMQMKARWAELKEEKKGAGNMEMESRLSALKRASRKKQDLANYLNKEGIPFSTNATIPAMFNLGEKAIFEDYEPVGTEKVNFGKFADLSYQQVAFQHPSYLDWVIQTARESDSPHWRLCRLARWGVRQKHQESAEQPHVTKGYQKHASPPKSESDGSYTVVSEPGRHNLEDKIEEHLTKFMAKKELEMQMKDQELEQLRRQLKEAEDAKNALELQQGRNKTRKET